MTVRVSLSPAEPALSQFKIATLHTSLGLLLVSYEHTSIVWGLLGALVFGMLDWRNP
jgi:hypothetical protein